MVMAEPSPKKPIVFWGATGHAKVLREFIGHMGYTLVAVFDNDLQTQSPYADTPIYIGQEGFCKWKAANRMPVSFLIAIGGGRGRDRLELLELLQQAELNPIVAIHPMAFVATDAVIGVGTHVLANAAVCTEVQTGRACIINTSAAVDHESSLGDGVHIGPGAKLAGRVKVGDFTFVGIGAIVLPRVTIGQDVIVGAGAVVTRDIPDNQVVTGVPARFRRMNKL